MSPRVFSSLWFLGLIALLLLAAECAAFHFRLLIAVDAIILLALLLASAWLLILRMQVGLIETVRITLQILIGILIYFAIYNLQQFHYTADGGITTRDLFSIDIPFLAGEVHGLRNFGELRDLHQSAQPWHYHDATYRLLARFNAENTLGDIAFAAPLAGYTLLAVCVFALVLRATKQHVIAWFAVLALFIASGWAGLDMDNYALSPSFVFGSVLMVSIILALDIARERTGGTRTTLFVIALLMMIALSETKIPSFLVIDSAFGLMALIDILRRSWRTAMEYSILTIIPLIVLALQAHDSVLMPANDFLVGAPLMGYANHLAALLHIPVSFVSPVTHSSIGLRSLFIIPYFLFRLFRFVADPRLISWAIIAIWVRPKSELSFLLALMVPLGFFLPVVYSPAWYPLAISTYAPFVGLQAAVLLVAIEWPHITQHKTQRTAIAILFGFSIATGLYQIVKADRTSPQTINADFVHAMDSIAAKVPQNAIIVSRRYNIEPKDESYYWYSALSGRSVVSEGAKYGSLLGAVADVDSAKGLHPVEAAEILLASRRSLIDSVYFSSDSAQVLSAMAQLHSNYVLLDRSNGDSLHSGVRLETVFSNSAVLLLKRYRALPEK